MLKVIQGSTQLSNCDETTADIVLLCNLACDGLLVLTGRLQIDDRTLESLRLLIQGLLELGGTLQCELRELLQKDFLVGKVLTHAVRIRNVA